MVHPRESEPGLRLIQSFSISVVILNSMVFGIYFESLAFVFSVLDAGGVDFCNRAMNSSVPKIAAPRDRT